MRVDWPIVAGRTILLQDRIHNLLSALYGGLTHTVLIPPKSEPTVRPLHYKNHKRNVRITKPRVILLL